MAIVYSLMHPKPKFLEKINCNPEVGKTKIEELLDAMRNHAQNFPRTNVYVYSMQEIRIESDAELPSYALVELTEYASIKRLQ